VCAFHKFVSKIIFFGIFMAGRVVFGVKQCIVIDVLNVVGLIV